MADPFFDAAYYLAKNPDVVAAGFTLATAEQHYLRYGAAESVDAPLRAPNAWFDAKAYLAAYPDLVAAGVTAATALYHYATYGIYEDRSPAGNVNPIDFTYFLYAANNPDLESAFGITDANHLTIVQQHALLAHYLSYGIDEHRPGVASPNPASFFYAAPVISQPSPLNIAVDGSAVNLTYSGGDLDDTFTSTDANLPGTTLKGFGGSDTLNVTWLSFGHSAVLTLDSVENIAVTMAPGSSGSLQTLGSPALHSVSVALNGLDFSVVSGKVDAFTLQGSGTATAIQQSGLSGTADTMHLTTGNAATNIFTANGDETYQITTGAGSSLSLHANAVDGNTLSVIANGGGAAQSSSITLFSGGSAALQTATLDASGVAGNQTLAVDASLAGVNTTITGGSGNDTLTGVSNASHTTTLYGNAGNDILRASAGQDLMTGGPGNDIFRFGTGTGAPISLVAGVEAVDTIFDLASGDTIEFTATGFSISSYARSDATLALAVAAVETAIAAPDTNAIFTLGTQAYFINSGNGATPAAIIKLVMADHSPFTGQMIADASGAHFVI
jgi:Ca2+-binding RTX toxin-like protein